MEYFLILCREPSVATTSLESIFSSFGQVEIVTDSHSTRNVWVPDESMAGFENLNRYTGSCKPVTAWSRAFRHLATMDLEIYEGIWIVEDDVAGNAGRFSVLIERNRAVGADLSAVEIRSEKEDPDWPHWWHAEAHFTNPFRSFNPLCRLSPRLIRASLAFRQKHQQFIFQEVFFASLAIQKGFSGFDWRRDPELAPLFRTFHFRPHIELLELGICHPVKDPLLVARICGS